MYLRSSDRFCQLAFHRDGTSSHSYQQCTEYVPPTPSLTFSIFTILISECGIPVEILMYMALMNKIDSFRMFQRCFCFLYCELRVQHLCSFFFFFYSLFILVICWVLYGRDNSLLLVLRVAYTFSKFSYIFWVCFWWSLSFRFFM